MIKNWKGGFRGLKGGIAAALPRLNKVIGSPTSRWRLVRPNKRNEAKEAGATGV